MPAVAVVVPAHVAGPDAADGLAACLDALARQTRAPAEIVVVDDASPAGVDVPAPARVLRLSRGGSYAARNAGIAATTAPIIAFTDADCRPDPTWLEHAVAALTDLDAVAGAIEVPLERGWVARYDALTAFPQRRFVERDGFGATANLVVRRAAFATAGVFDATLFSGGDAEWGARAGAAGVRLGYRDDVRVHHPPRRTLGAVLRKALRITRGIEQLAAARGDASPWWHAVADRLARPARDWPVFREALGPVAALPVLGVAVVFAVVVAAETVRLRVQAARPVRRVAGSGVPHRHSSPSARSSSDGPKVCMPPPG
jgi:glycosyltransferase involved in cell wall biosynthesis